MSTKNLIRKENKFDKTYFAEVISNNDPLKRGRLQVKIDAILGDNPFWVNSTLVAGQVQFLLIPETSDIVKVSFKNKDIYSGEWSLEGCPNNQSNIDPKKYGLSDNNGNCIIIDRETNSISIKSQSNSITANDTFVTGNFGASTGATELIPLDNGVVLSFVNGLFIGSS